MALVPTLERKTIHFREARKADTRRKQRKKMVILEAPDFWPDSRREILDWHIAGSEEHKTWEVGIQRIWERGCGVEKAYASWDVLALIDRPSGPEKHCLFHTLLNVSAKVRSERAGKEHQEQHKPLMKQAAAISHAETAAQACVSLAQWAQQWREHVPQLVTTLECDCAQTLVFDEMTCPDLAWIRTPSTLERTTHEFRRTFRQAVTFGSMQSAEVAISLHVRRLHAQWQGETWWDTSQQVLFDRWHLNSSGKDTRT